MSGVRASICRGLCAESVAQPHGKRSRNQREGGAMASNQSTRSWLSEPAILSAEKGTAQLGEIVVFMDGHAKVAGILEFIGVLAQEHGARLISGLVRTAHPITPPRRVAA